MADSGLFIGFGGPVRGREQQAIKAFNESFRILFSAAAGG